MTTFRTTAAALLTAAMQVRVWFLGWLLVTLPALFLVWPLLLALQQDLDHHPGATLTLGEGLDLDFARQHPGLALQGGGAVLLVLLGWTFLGGGILATVGLRTRASLSDFLAACGRGLWPGLRVLAIGFVLALLLNWGVGYLDAWLAKELADVDPGAAIAPFGLHSRWFTLAFGLELLHWFYGLLFLLLLFAAKVARAQLCAADRRSAAMAWLRAIGKGLRHPIRAVLTVVVLAAVWMLSGLLLGWAVAWSESGGRLWLMVAATQLHVVVLQVVLAANFLAARSFAGTEPAAAAPEDDDAVPIEDDSAAAALADPAG